MGATYGWGTAVVVASVLAFAGGGAAYLVKEWNADNGEAEDGGVVADANPDARARGKTKPGKKGTRGGKPRRRTPRGSGNAGAANAAAGNAAAGNAAAGNAGSTAGGNAPGGNDDNSDDLVDDAENRPPPFRGRGPAGPTYEAALASNTQEVTIGKQAAPDLTDAQLSGPMQGGGFVGECGAPDSMKVTVKVAIKMGHAAGVSVSTSPSDPDVAGCIDRYVRTFSWPASSKMDSFTTTY